jgi:GIY-YIG catalytic domain
MPRTAIDYRKSCVYRIIWNHSTKYVGSTTNFKNRKSGHKSNCSNKNCKEYNRPLYKFIRETGGWSDDWCMVLVEEYPNCKSSIELLKYEREHFDFYKPELNMNKPCLKEGEVVENLKKYYVENSTKIKEKRKQYYTENIDKIKVYSKQYQIENADTIKEYNKVYHEENSDKLKEISRQYYIENLDKIKEQTALYRAENSVKIIERNKQYREENRDKKIETDKQYYIKNINKIKENNKIKHTCECGSTYTRINILRHNKTQKHVNYLNNVSV